MTRQPSPERRRVKRPIRQLLVTLVLANAACDAASQGDAIVARAAEHELPVETVVGLLAASEYPNDVQVPYTIGDIWTDYILLATALAEDSTLSQLDLSGIVEQQVDQELILQLRDVAAQPDTTITEEEIRERYEQTAPGARARVRHIFLALPESATAAQRDSVRAVAAGLREQIVGGASFEELAMEHSDDATSAGAGGELGVVDRNELMGPLDSAAFAVPPGEVSGVIETIYGYHVLRVDEREAPELGEILPEFRAALLRERVAAAESVLVASVQDEQELEVQDDAAELVRRAAQSPGMELARRAQNRALVAWDGGALTMQDVIEFMRSRVSQYRVDIYRATDEAITQNLLIPLAQRELLATAARERGLEVSEARRDSLTQDLRSRMLANARELGLMQLPSGDDEAARAAREQHVEDVIRQLVQGRIQVVPLGSLAFLLRERYGSSISMPGVESVVARLDAVRGAADTPADSQTAPPLPGDGPTAPGLPPADGGNLEPPPGF